MKTHIQFFSTNFNVNKAKRTIACVMTVAIMGTPYQAVGLSICSEDDVFDETLGKRIAESRAKAKVYSAASNIYKEDAVSYNNAADNMRKLSEFCKALHKKEKEHIKNLSNL